MIDNVDFSDNGTYCEGHRMSKEPSSSTSIPIRAAGGIILGAAENDGKIAIVRRHRYAGEIALPKGKLREGEGEADAALREVTEETGYKVRIRTYAGTTHYSVGSSPKVVTYFMMETDGSPSSGPEDTEEIASVEWVTPHGAIGLLTHQEDRDLIATVFNVDMSESR